MTPTVRTTMAALAWGVLAWGAFPSAGQAQADPTRPSFAMPTAPAAALGGAGQPGLVAPGGVGTPGAGLVPRAVRPAAPPTPRVSSVVVSSPEFSSAVIDDRVYRLGEKVPDLGSLVGIDGTGVSLRSAQATRRLALWSRKAAAPARSASSVDAKGPSAAASASSVEAKE